MSAKTGLHSDIAKAVQSGVEKLKYPLVAQHFQRCADKLAAKINALQKNNGRIATTNLVVEELQQLRLLKSCRPYNLSYDTTLLDSTVLLQDSTVSFVMAAGTSVREAKKQVYLTSICRQKELDVLVMSEQCSQHRLATKKETFVKDCLDVPGGTIETNMFQSLWTLNPRLLRTSCRLWIARS